MALKTFNLFRGNKSSNVTKEDIKNTIFPDLVSQQASIENLENSPGGGNTFESLIFTLSADAGTATLSINGGEPELINADPAGEGKWKITFPTTKRLKLWQGLTFKTGTPSLFIEGKSDGTNQWCSGSSIDASVSSNDSNCIYVTDGAPKGWTGLITAINPTDFDITFTKVGNGLAITGQVFTIQG